MKQELAQRIVYLHDTIRTVEKYYELNKYMMDRLIRIFDLQFMFSPIDILRSDSDMTIFDECYFLRQIENKIATENLKKIDWEKYGAVGSIDLTVDNLINPLYKE